MRKYRKSLWANTLLSFGAAILFGGICYAAAVTVLSAISYWLIGSMQFVGIFTIASLVCTAYFSGRIYGKYRRRRGLIDGSICGLLLYSVISAAGLVVVGAPADIKKLLLLVIAGAAGGVAGVNSKRPKSLMENQ
jgi:putative membrane protein (TIGR04086 family)